MNKPPGRVPLSQTVFLVVFGVFTLVGLYQVIGGTATNLTWLSLAVSALLFAGTAYRVLRYSRKPDA
jgi:hypothetical protein